MGIENRGYMNLSPRIMDSMGKPIQTGYRYRVEHELIGSMVVDVYCNEAGDFVCRDVSKPVGNGPEFECADLPVDTIWNLDMKRSVKSGDIEMSQPLVDPIGMMTDRLSAIESKRIGLQRELLKLENEACNICGCERGDGSQCAEACFDLIHNGKYAESVVVAFERSVLNLC